jgi:hypothetical protein
MILDEWSAIGSEATVHLTDCFSGLKLTQYRHFWVLTNFGNDVRVEIELQAMMRKPHTDCFPTPATFAWQGAGEGTFM